MADVRRERIPFLWSTVGTYLCILYRSRFVAMAGDEVGFFRVVRQSVLILFGETSFVRGTVWCVTEISIFVY